MHVLHIFLATTFRALLIALEVSDAGTTKGDLTFFAFFWIFDDHLTDLAGKVSRKLSLEAVGWELDRVDEYLAFNRRQHREPVLELWDCISVVWPLKTFHF